MAKLDGLIAAKRKKLENKSFVDRAPAAVVQGERDSLADLESQRAAAAASSSDWAAQAGELVRSTRRLSGALLDAHVAVSATADQLAVSPRGPARCAATADASTAQPRSTLGEKPVAPARLPAALPTSHPRRRRDL